ncbi:MAG: hypothetical protein K0S58_646 [Nitrospira sp.]|nr:hypothetical protein [Nitrospira sp.]
MYQLWGASPISFIDFKSIVTETVTHHFQTIH